MKAVKKASAPKLLNTKETATLEHMILLNVFGFQDKTCSLCKGTEAHAVDTDQSLGHRAWNSASYKRDVTRVILCSHLHNYSLPLNKRFKTKTKNPQPVAWEGNKKGF